MRFKIYPVKVTIIETDEGDIYTGWIEGIKGAIVQTESLSETFTELGIQLKILKELEDGKLQTRTPGGPGRGI